jgi:hypothetical protein
LQTELSRIKITPLYSCCAQLYFVEGSSGSFDIVLNQLQNGLVCLLKWEDRRFTMALVFPQQVEEHSLSCERNITVGSAVRVIIVVVACRFKAWSCRPSSRACRAGAGSDWCAPCSTTASPAPARPSPPSSNNGPARRVQSIK